jgi:hypothetical protein
MSTRQVVENQLVLSGAVDGLDYQKFLRMFIRRRRRGLFSWCRDRVAFVPPILSFEYPDILICAESIR